MLWQNVCWIACVWVSTEDALSKRCLCALWIITGGVYEYCTMCVWLRKEWAMSWEQRMACLCWSPACFLPPPLLVRSLSISSVVFCILFFVSSSFLLCVCYPFFLATCFFPFVFFLCYNFSWVNCFSVQSTVSQHNIYFFYIKFSSVCTADVTCLWSLFVVSECMCLCFV